MGMDTFEMVLKIEKTFGVELPSSDFLELMEDGDLRVGTLYGYIMRQKGHHDTIRTSFGLNLAFWRQMRTILHEVTGRSTAEIQLATPLTELFPRGTRPDDWKHFREVCPWEVGSLDYSALVRYLGLALALALLALEIFQWRELFSNSKWIAVFLILGMLVFAESYAKVLWFLRPLRRRFPAKVRTVKDLCRMVLAVNAVAITQELHGQETRLSAEVWEQLTEIIAEVAGVDRREIHFNTGVIRDLGFD